jgi:hypothetical protein
VAANVASLTIDCAPDDGAGVHIETNEIAIIDQLGIQSSTVDRPTPAGQYPTFT